MKKKILIIFFGVIFLRFLYTCFVGIIKPAVFEFAINKNNYIICKYNLTSGFDWRMIQNEFDEETNEYVVINQLNTEDSINAISDTVKASENTFVFYIRNKYIGKNDIGDDCLVYDVEAWDIVYPIKRDRILGFMELSGFLTQNDVVTSSR